MTHPVDLVSSLLATTVALPRGLASRPVAEQPAELLALYDIENCPYCRIVRETLTGLDLDAMIYPCPKGGERFRPKVVAMGGKAQFPFLVDANTGSQLYESAAIIRYLYQTYAHRPAPPALWISLISTATSDVASLLRYGQGTRVRASAMPAKPLALWSFESSPYARLVRERLCELEIPYRLHNMGRDKAGDFIPPGVRKRWMSDYRHTGRNRAALSERTGVVQVPYLFDPNTGIGLFESGDIIDYLMDNYAA